MTEKTVWVSKYALSCGIRTGVIEFQESCGTRVDFRDGTGAWMSAKHVHATREEAVAAAEKMRGRKIASLAKQIEKLQAMTFTEDAK